MHGSLIGFRVLEAGVQAVDWQLGRIRTCSGCGNGVQLGRITRQEPIGNTWHAFGSFEFRCYRVFRVCSSASSRLRHLRDPISIQSEKCGAFGKKGRSNAVAAILLLCRLPVIITRTAKSRLNEPKFMQCCALMMTMLRAFFRQGFKNYRNLGTNVQRAAF